MTIYLVLAIIIAILSQIFPIYLLLQNSRLRKKLKYVDEANMWHRLAITDDLTGLYNRNAYNNKIIKMNEDSTKKSYGIILFDVDNFKTINDTKGHLIGDKVLQNIAKTLREVFNSSEFEIFRIGGDEFSVITENILETEIIKKLLLLKKYIEKQEIGLSKGYSLVESDVYEAFKYADDMLYSDKLAKNARENINSDM